MKPIVACFRRERESYHFHVRSDPSSIACAKPMCVVLVVWPHTRSNPIIATCSTSEFPMEFPCAEATTVAVWSELWSLWFCHLEYHFGFELPYPESWPYLQPAAAWRFSPGPGPWIIRIEQWLCHSGYTLRQAWTCSGRRAPMELVL